MTEQKQFENLEKLKELVDRFRINLADYKSSRYDEENTKIDFIDKFFELLDWDLYNKQGYSEDFREVVREDKVYYRKQVISPDYSFKIGKERQFFVEAKKPSVNIHEGISEAYQIKRYAFTAGIPVSILTDFEEFAIYDTRQAPKPTDSPATARIFYCTFMDYEKNWEYLYNTFSKTAVLKGNLKRYVEDNKVKKGTQTIDKAMLQTIDKWREELAKNIALRNKGIDIYMLNEAVQKIIDRIIFLRIAEDRKTEIERYLEILTESPNIYSNLTKYFFVANNKYNSGLFAPVQWLDNLALDDKTLKSIIRDIYYPSPYEFSALPIEILGQIYEQFLGKTIRLTAGGQAKIEEKPEVRKAGGVYYTPQYIVDYIVENTVGKLIENKAPKDIEHITVLDPACGSGSFLVRAYDYLLNYHLKWFSQEQNRERAIRDGKIYRDAHESYRLTIRAKKKILLDNIYGVDIDSQAVEVTRLSLLLKLMEGEIVESRNELFLKSQTEALLPDLSNNIKCGNSLIGTDFYQDKDMQLFGADEQRKINCFDWEVQFKDIMKAGGFDCVIGNPPYLRIQGLQEYHSGIVPFLKKAYKSASSGSIDIYLIFLEKILKLINSEGLTGYILPHKFFQGDLGKNIREIINQKSAINKIVNFGANQIFENATTYTCLFFMSGKKQDYFDYYKFDLGDDIISNLNNIKFSKIKIEQLSSDKWNFHSGFKEQLFQKLDSMPFKLKDIIRKIFQGIPTGCDKIFVLKLIDNAFEDKNYLILYSNELKKEIRIEKGILKPFLMGKDVKRYEKPKVNNYVIFPYKILDNKAILLTSNEIKENYPLCWEYLKDNKSILEKRENYRFQNTWWQYSRPQNLNEFEIKKILTPEISNSCKMTIDKDGIIYHTTKVYSFVFKENIKENNYYFFGILNSQLLFFFLKSTGYVLRGGYYTFKTNYLSPFPIKTIDFSNKSEKAQHDRMVSLVDQMLEAQKEYHSGKIITESDKKLVKQRIEILDRQIDTLVYELYGLTEEEIKIVEGEG